MHKFIPNPRDKPDDPEYTYCCGSGCDKDKLAWEFEDLRAKVVVADKLVADLLTQIEVLQTTNKALGTQQALYYKWYLEECAKRDKPA